ncbi:MAG TPA: GNAT family N-acetyltransferase [Flavisolibacter sp.]|nr:GNAT family N-acetyltransferase [Flavisolibacter sp.]
MAVTSSMQYREATIDDIPQLQTVRNAVKENALSDPSLVKDADYIPYLQKRGKGWICEADSKIVGFAIADVQSANIWALFLLPAYEGKGIGRKLHGLMLDWYFSQTDKTVWLSTAPHSRAERFYRKAGWQEAGTYGKGETKFEMTKEMWRRNRS